jgi:hypothetical protein
MVSPHCCHVFYLAVLPTFLLLVGSNADDVFREDPLGKEIFLDFENSFGDFIVFNECLLASLATMSRDQVQKMLQKISNVYASSPSWWEVANRNRRCQE